MCVNELPQRQTLEQEAWNSTHEVMKSSNWHSCMANIGAHERYAILGNICGTLTNKVCAEWKWDKDIVNIINSPT